MIDRYRFSRFRLFFFVKTCAPSIPLSAELPISPIPDILKTTTPWLNISARLRFLVDVFKPSLGGSICIVAPLYKSPHSVLLAGL